MAAGGEGFVELAQGGVHLQQAIEQDAVFGRFAERVVEGDALLEAALIGDGDAAAEFFDVDIEASLAGGAFDEGFCAGDGKDGDEKEREPVAALHGDDAGLLAAGGADGVDRRLGALAEELAPAEEDDEAAATTHGNPISAGSASADRFYTRRGPLKRTLHKKPTAGYWSMQIPMFALPLRVP